MKQVLDALAAGAGGEQLDPAVGEMLLEELEEVGIVVDDEYPRPPGRREPAGPSLR